MPKPKSIKKVARTLWTSCSEIVWIYLMRWVRSSSGYFSRYFFYLKITFKINFQALATLSHGQDYVKTSNEKFVAAVFDKIWTHCPDIDDFKINASTGQGQANLNLMDTEPAMFVMHNLVENVPETYSIIERKEKHWRERWTIWFEKKF